jgi:hypothetical protein
MSKRCIIIDSDSNNKPIKPLKKKHRSIKPDDHSIKKTSIKKPIKKKQIKKEVDLDLEPDNCNIISFINSIVIKHEPKEEKEEKEEQSDFLNTVINDDLFMETSDTSLVSYEPMTIENITTESSSPSPSPSPPSPPSPVDEHKILIQKKIEIVDTKNTRKNQKTHKLDTTRTRLASTVLTGEELDIPIDSSKQNNTTNSKTYVSHSKVVSNAIENKQSIIDNIDTICEQVFNIESGITSLDRFIHNSGTSLPSMIPSHPIVHTLIKFTKEINDNSKKAASDANYVIPVVSRSWVESMLYEPPRDNIWPTCSSGTKCLGLHVFPGHKVLLRSFFASCEKKNEVKNIQDMVQEETNKLGRHLTEDEYNNLVRLHARMSLVPLININSQKPTPGPCFLCLCTFVINTSIRYMLTSSKCPSNTLWNPIRVLTGINGEFPIHACFYDTGKTKMICDAIYCPSIHTLQPIVSEDGLKGFKFLFDNNIDYHFLA